MKKVVFILCSLILIRSLMTTGFIVGVPELKWHNGFLFHQGGDHIKYFQQAIDLSSFSFEKDWKYPIGYPLFLLPFVVLYSASQWQDIIKPVVIIQGYLLVSIAIILIYLICNHLVHSRSAALIASGLFALFPYILFICLSGHPHKEILRGANISNQSWFTMCADGLSTFFVILSVWLLIKAYKSQSKILAFLLGLSLGYVVLLRYANITFLGLSLVFLFIRKYKLFFYVAFGIFIMSLPQCLYNTYAFGLPTKIGYMTPKQVAEDLAKYGVSSYFGGEYIIKFLREILKYKLFSVVVVLFGICLLWELYKLFKFNKISFAILIIWIFPYILLHLFSLVLTQDPIRYLILVYPAIFILIGDFCKNFFFFLKFFNYKQRFAGFMNLPKKLLTWILFII